MRRWAWLLPLLAVAAVFALRLAGPPDFLDKDQPRPIDYIVDAAVDGDWIVQQDAGGGVTSKPPLYTWLAAGSTLAFGAGRFALYLPCAAAMAAVALIAALLARRRLGWAAGLAAGMVVALAFDTQKAVVLARTDAVFAGCVAGAAWLALRAWESGRGWIVFWLACAVVCLAKTPAGVAFAAGGLLAACWRRERPACALGGTAWQHAVGVPLMLAITAAWLLLAVETLGMPVVDRLLGRELVGHITANDKDAPWLETFWQPPLWHASLFMPWTLLLGAALWRLQRQPPAAPRRRRFLRFMACWLGCGLLLLVLAPHKRMVLALPMLLAGAVLAGAEAGRWLARYSRRRQLTIWAAAALAVIAGLGAYHATRDPAEDRIGESRAVLTAAAGLGRLRARGIDIAWHRSLPPSIRYFTPGHPPWTRRAQEFLAKPGPGAVAMPEDRQLPTGARVLRMAPGIVVVLDDEAATLAP